MSQLDLVTPRTKGLRLADAVPVDVLRQQLRSDPQRLDGPLFALPLLTLDDDALTHNITTMAELCAERGVWHAPHVKTHMSPQIWARQATAGAWAATVAAPHQLRAAHDWGAERLLLANELADHREAVALRALMAADRDVEVWLQVDSIEGVALLATHLSGTMESDRLHVLVEYGLPGGRTGARSLDETVALAQAVLDAGLNLGGVTGYEGPVASGATANDLAAVAAWCDQLGLVAQRVHALFPTRSGGVTGALHPDWSVGVTGALHPDWSVGVTSAPTPDWSVDATGALTPDRPHESTGVCPPGGVGGVVDNAPFIVSAGGSAYLDVVLDRLAPIDHPSPLGDGMRLVVRSGAYVTHDHLHYAHLDPWARLPGDRSLRPAITVWAPVVSTPEPGLVLLGLGRRDISFDLDLPVPLWHRDGPARTGLTLGPRADFGPGQARITELNDQHAFLRGPGVAVLRPGDVIGLGISHPCTTLDKWRVAALTRDDPVSGMTLAHDLHTLDF